ncbi:MAG: TOBE domain-containing protein, partial [Paracoccaceae bacterium]
RKLGVTMVYVTHDQIEAVTMADQVVLMNRGRIEQATDPKTLYEQPASVFAAGFIGTPPMCLFPISVFRPDALSHGIDDSLTFGIRPECFELAEAGPVFARVRRAEFQGADTLVTAESEGAILTLRLQGSRTLHPGTLIHLGFRDAALHLFDTATGRRRDDLSGKVRGGLDPG